MKLCLIPLLLVGLTSFGQAYVVKVSNGIVIDRRVATDGNVTGFVPAPEYVLVRWRQSGAVWLRPDGTAPTGKETNLVARLRLRADTIADAEQALANWSSLTAAQQKAVLKRVVEFILLVLKDERIDLRSEQ